MNTVTHSNLSSKKGRQYVAIMFRQSPELFFPVALLIVWRALRVPPSSPGLWIDGVLVISLCWYGSWVLGTTQWIKRLGWIEPAPVFWGWSATAGFFCAFVVLGLARATGLPVGTVYSLHLVLLASTAGPILEELLFRGLLYWVLHKILRQFGVPTMVVNIFSILVLAVLFAFAHADRETVHLWSAIFTGAAVGYIRVASRSTACAALMHACYNFTLSWLALVF
jgi:membrane protease YdiL (CAAX protease family)